MRFTIPKGKEFYVEFEIKEPGSGTPMDITGATAKFSLSSIGVACSPALTDIPMIIADALNGLVALKLTPAQTSTLVSRVGFEEDGYPPVATYKGRIDISNIVDPISVDIPQVYISNMSCS